MVDVERIKRRIVTAERYLALIDEGRAGTWHEAKLEALASSDLVLAMTLVHPQFWSDWKKSTEVLGPREFRVPNLVGTRYCAAADYWGVECASQRRLDAEIVADHAWPYSLGGPTVVGNIRWLCRRHNSVKSSDVHLYPWEGLWPDWLNEQLAKLAAFIPG